MNFEELQSLWNRQNDESESHLDTEAVLNSVRQRSQKLGVETNRFELSLIWMLVLVGLVALRDPVLQGHDMHQIVTGVLCLGSAAFIWRGRIRRKKLEIQFDDSMLGTIEKSIAQHHYKATQVRSYGWSCIVPLSVGLVLGYIQADPSKHIWFHFLVIPLFVLLMAFSYFVLRWEVNRCNLPHLAELEDLRAKLLEPE